MLSRAILRLPDDEPAVVSLLTVDGVLTVRRGPARIYAVMGELETGQQHPVTGRNFDGSWWQIEYEGQAWVGLWCRTWPFPMLREYL